MGGIGYGRFLGLFHGELPEPAILESDESPAGKARLSLSRHMSTFCPSLILCLIRVLGSSHVYIISFVTSTDPYIRVGKSHHPRVYTHHERLFRSCRYYPNESHGDLDVDHRFPVGCEGIHPKHGTRSGWLAACFGAVG